jgi:hypothetical protein
MTFVRAAAITPLDPKDMGARYTIWAEKTAEGRNDRWDFNQRVLNELLGHK